MSGHGWVTPNPNGVVARCGGPAICSECALEYARKYYKPKEPLLMQHPPEFDTPEDELRYCTRLLDEARVTRDTWIGKGERVSDRLTWLLRSLQKCAP